MITIKETSRDFSKVENYLMTVAPSMLVIKDLEDGTKIPVAGYLIFEDSRDNADVVEILSIITPDKRVYTCQSKTFKQSFHDIFTVMDGDPVTIIKISGKNNSGRMYINCILDVDSVQEFAPENAENAENAEQ